MKKIGSVLQYNIMYDEKAKVNPYRIVSTYYGYDKNNVFGKHQKTVARYADLKSCLYDLYASI